MTELILNSQPSRCCQITAQVFLATVAKYLLIGELFSIVGSRELYFFLN